MRLNVKLARWPAAAVLSMGAAAPALGGSVTRPGDTIGLAESARHSGFYLSCGPETETMDSSFAEPMRRDCTDLTEAVIPSGHWMAQEHPIQVDAAPANCLADKAPDVWPASIDGSSGKRGERLLDPRG